MSATERFLDQKLTNERHLHNTFAWQVYTLF